MVKVTDPARTRHRVERVLVVAVSLSALAVGGCGGGSKSSSTTTPSSRTATTATTRAATSSRPTGAASVTTGPVRVSLTAPNHAPAAGKLWRYSVKVSDASGKPLPGTVDTEFLFGGQVVGREAPPTHSLKNGALHDAVTWPAQAVGEPLALRVVVHTSQRTITLDWPVTVKR